MKKLYLSVLALALANASFGQELKQNGAEKNLRTPGASYVHQTVKPSPNGNVATAKVAHFQDNFDTWPLTQWTISSGPSSNTTDPAHNWHEDVNYAESGSAAAVEYANSTDYLQEYMTTSTGLLIPATGSQRVRFDFLGNAYWHVLSYGGIDNADQLLMISTDPTFATGVDTLWQEDRDDLLIASGTMDWWDSDWYYAGGDPYSYTTARIDITSYAGQTVYFRWVFEGQDGAWFHLDNFFVEDVPDNDIALEDAWHADVFLDWENSMRPLAQARELYPGAIVSNNGGLSQTFDVTLDIPEASYNSSQSVTLAPNEKDTVWFMTGYTPSANNTFNFNFTIPADEDNSNNAISAGTLEINDFIMAHDYGVEGAFGWDAAATDPTNANNEHGWGNVFVLEQTATAYGVDVVFADNTSVGLPVIVTVWEVTDGNIQGNLVQVAQEIFDIQASNVGNAVVTTVPLSGGASLTAGTMYIVEVRKEASVGESMFIGGSNSSTEDDDFSTVGYGDYSATPGTYTFFNGWGFSPYIRLNFEDQTSISENDMLGLNVFPNPAVDNATVSFELNGEASVNVTVTDLAGKVVYTNNLGNVAGAQNVEINTASMANGVYMVNVDANGAVSTQKLVVRK